ncbi:EamA family transporter RarD, partial [Mycobacterium sp. ITM-2017-0098]
PMRWMGFALIWLALLVFTVDAVRRARFDRRVSAPLVG